MAYLNNGTSKLFRVLRDDENPKTDGLTAKNPQATKSLIQHVLDGSWTPGSQFISCSNNEQSAIDFGMKKAGNAPFKIAELDRNAIENDPNIRVSDVSDGTSFKYEKDNNFSREQCEKANNFARIFGEVCLEGHVPAEYVRSVTPYPGGMN